MGSDDIDGHGGVVLHGDQAGDPMTAQCYHCAAEEHGDCQRPSCTCCGAIWQKHLDETEAYFQAFLESSTFRFHTTEERDAFVEKFECRTCTDTPGVFSLPGGGTLAVWCNEVTVYEPKGE